MTELCHEVRACEGCEDVGGVAAGVELAPPQPRGVVAHAAAGPRPRAAASLLAPAVVVHLAAALLRTRDTLLRHVTRDSNEPTSLQLTPLPPVKIMGSPSRPVPCEYSP